MVSRAERLRTKERIMAEAGISHKEYEERVRARASVMAEISYQELIQALSVAHYLFSLR